MQHIKPLGKGDALCPLGFHPQVRWPTRCKRCFRDYKEHGYRNKEQEFKLQRNNVTASSSPSLDSWTSQTDDKPNATLVNRSWTSTSNLNADNINAAPSKTVVTANFNETSGKGTSSWTSTPDLGSLSEQTKANVETTVSLTLPRRKHANSSDTPQDNTDDHRRTQFTVRRRVVQAPANSKPVATTNSVSSAEHKNSNSKQNSNNMDVDFLLRMKDSVKAQESRASNADKDDIESNSDAASTTNTDDTEATLVNDNHLQVQIEHLKQQLFDMRVRCERAEKEKNDMLLRRVASLDNTISTKTTSNELSKLQKKFDNMKTVCDNLDDEKRRLMQKNNELENDLKSIRNSNKLEKEIEQLKSKLLAAESLCEELMDENEEVKKELRDMEDEIEEMQDNFRENEADEYTTIKKELEQTGKNCRILSFKLKKFERRAELLETEKNELERKLTENITELEKQLEEANEKANQFNERNFVKKKPMLGNIPKLPSGEKVSRASLTRGGSQEDPVQLQRDLQDSIEREADLKEQLRYAEEEAQNLRKKVARVEDDNESLLMQLKKVATKARSRRSSPTLTHLSPESAIEKDEGISDEEDPAELKILLELSEQETTNLRKKVEELEETCNMLKRKANDFQDKLVAKNQKSVRHENDSSKDSSFIKKMEDEISDLKNKLKAKEQECSQLNGELTSGGKKKSKTLQKSRSLDYDQHAVNLQQQLKVVEQETDVLRSRNCALEIENEKLQAENKQLMMTKAVKNTTTTKLHSSEVASLKTKITTLEKQLETSRKKENDSDKKLLEEINQLKLKCSDLQKENIKLSKNLKLLKEGNAEEFIDSFSKNRKTVYPLTDGMEKSELMKMVQQLQGEIEDVLLAFEKCSSDYKDRLNKLQNNSEQKLQISDLEETVTKMEKQLAEYKDKISRLEKDRERIINEKRILETTKLKFEETKAKEKLARDKEKTSFEDQKKKYIREVSELKLQNATLSTDLKNNQKKNAETDDQLASAYQELEEKRKSVDALKIKLETAQNAVKNSSKFSAEITEKNRKIAELEKKIADIEEKFKKSDKLVQIKKEKISNLENELEMLKQDNVSMKGAKDQEKDTLKNKIGALEKQLAEQTAEIKEKTLQIQKLELKYLGDKNIETSGIVELEKSLAAANEKIRLVNEKLAKITKEKKLLEDASQTITNDLRKEVNQSKANASKLELDLQAERDLMAKYKSDKEKIIQEHEFELKTLRKKVTTINDKEVQHLKNEFSSAVHSLKMELARKQKEYDELYSKYNNGETEHIRTKSQLTSQIDKIQNQLLRTERESRTTRDELQSLKSTYNTKQDIWMKEKFNLEKKLKESENSIGNIDLYKREHSKLKAVYDVTVSQLEKLKKEMEVQVDQIDILKKENEELHNKLDDYEKVSKVQRNMIAETSTIENELREYKNRLYNEEHARKIEVAALKVRYENHIAAISDELKDVQSQLMRFKHERDNYKHLLESINQRKSTADTRSDLNVDRQESDNYDEVDKLNTEVATLEQQISCMEDELSEARVECSRLKTELVSERSAWEVKVSEMMSRINELEEDRVLHSGRTKIAGLKTRMELSWQKEREEQNRLLQETSTLARDLRQTLFEVERERDKERLETKRRINLLKKNMDEEQEESRKKLSELQCDLVELRETHAKLRTTNEKLRREKERLENEKENIIRQQSVPRQTMAADEDEQKKMACILDLVSELLKIAPQYYSTRTEDSSSLPMITNKRADNSSRESSLEHRSSSRESSIHRDDTRHGPLQSTLQKLSDVIHQLKSPNQMFHMGKSSLRKSFSSKRSSSTESDNNARIESKPSVMNLRRKCISLEQTAQIKNSNDQIVWRTDEDTDGSMSSFQSFDDPSYNARMNNGFKTDQTFDSRLSGGSTQSEITPSSLEKKKKKGIFGRLKILKKSSKSFDDVESFPVNSSNQTDPGVNSNTSSHVIPNSDSVKKKDLKGHFSSMFKKSDSRSSSLERNKPPVSEVVVQSPAVRISSANTLPRMSSSSTSAVSSSKKKILTGSHNKLNTESTTVQMAPKK